ncbi:MAG TPA: RIO1 family regulatory kinase/ATPase [Acidimicrobiales bacterium]|nr:RIO1 family regulatory kinase/ATPase [Acidimicrobiales bacterium]
MPRSRPRDDEDSPKHDAFQPTVHTPRPRWDDDVVDPEQTTYTSADPGPSPVPDWVITDDAARQFERGVIKTGKEADVYLVERVLGPRVNLLAAKRYRDLDERAFRNDAKYRKRTGDRRVDLAMAQGTRAGMSFRAQLWLETEFESLSRLWAIGCAVPYPVQKLGVELMMEYIGDEEEAAPRLINAVGGLDRDATADLFTQLCDALRLMTSVGIVHGDLSPYNLLVWQERLYVIDMPQAVDPILQPEGLGLLERDVVNLCKWFSSKGVATDAVSLHRELLELLRAGA